MKKTTFKLLALALTLASALTLFACTFSHTHTFREAWSSDLDRHWHYCDTEGCLERSEDEEHTWDEGVVAAKPTPEVAGVKKFTCTKCGSISTHPYTYEQHLADTEKAD